jgi:hypothetical protein
VYELLVAPATQPVAVLRRGLANRREPLRVPVQNA